MKLLLQLFKKFGLLFIVTTTTFCAYSQPNFTIFAGNDLSRPGYRDGKGTDAMFNQPNDVAIDKDDNLYVADYENHVIRKITPDGNVTTLAGTPRFGGFKDDKGTSALFYHPISLVTDTDGNVFVVDENYGLIRKILPDGTVSTFAGGASGNDIVDGQGTKAGFRGPNGIAIDANNNLYVTERFNAAVRKITSTGLVSTLGGNGYSVLKDGPFGVAQFEFPNGITIDSAGNLLVAEYNEHKIRSISPDGTVSTIAGNGNSGNVDSTYLKSSFRCPSDLFTGNDGNIYVIDRCNGNVRILNKKSRVRTIIVNDNFDNVIRSQYASPTGGAMDKAGNIYLADPSNNRIFKISTGITAIEENQKENLKFSIFPNPTSSILHIQTGSQSFTNTSCSIYTLQGTLVETKEVNFQNSTSEINVAHLDAGTYIVELSSNSNIQKNLFIKTK
jgi:sugar lactone lactonase YvrE